MNRIRIAVISLFVIFFSLQSYPQQKPNSIYLELFGNGVVYSINYDRMLSENFGARIGLMYLPRLDMVFYAFDDLLIIPVMFNFFVGSGNSKLELGGGISFVSITGGSVFGFDAAESETGIAGTATFGYRYQSPRSGIIFRAGLTPVFTDEGAKLYGGLSFGFIF